MHDHFRSYPFLIAPERGFSDGNDRELVDKGRLDLLSAWLASSREIGAYALLGSLLILEADRSSEARILVGICVKDLQECAPELVGFSSYFVASNALKRRESK